MELFDFCIVFVWTFVERNNSRDIPNLTSNLRDFFLATLHGMCVVLSIWEKTCTFLCSWYGKWLIAMKNKNKRVSDKYKLDWLKFASKIQMLL